jgi:hypothetical protein
MKNFAGAVVVFLGITTSARAQVSDLCRVKKDSSGFELTLSGASIEMHTSAISQQDGSCCAKRQ